MKFSTKQSIEKANIRIDETVFGLSTVAEIDQRLCALTERMASDKDSLTSGSQIDLYSNLVHLKSENNSSSDVFYREFKITTTEVDAIADPSQREDFIISRMAKCIKDQVTSKYPNMERFRKQGQTEELLAGDAGAIGFADTCKKIENVEYFLVARCKKKLQYALIETLSSEVNQNSLKNHPSHQNLIKEKGHSRAASASTMNTRRRMLSVQEPIRIVVKQKLIEFKVEKVQWSEALEKQFKSKKGQGTQVQLYPIIQKTLLDNIGHSLWAKQREALLAKYTEGAPLTAEEMHFISNTSVLLNQYADRQFIQRTIDYLDKSIIDQLELGIAEGILNLYSLMQQSGKEARKQYLISQNKSEYLNKQIMHQNLLQKIQTQQKQQRLNRIKRKMICIFRDFTRNQDMIHQRLLEKEHFLKEQKGSYNLIKGPNKIIFKFKEHMMEIVKKYRSRKENEQARQFMERNTVKKEKLLFKVNGQMRTTEMIKRLFHPPSKLSLDGKNERILKASSVPRIRKQFQSFLSGGPQSRRRYQSNELKHLNKPGDQTGTHDWINSEVEVTAINKIKSALRRHLQRKKQLLREEQRLQQIHEIQTQRIQAEKDHVKHVKHIGNKFLENLTERVKAAPKQVERKYSMPMKYYKGQLSVKARKLFQAVKKMNLSIAKQSGFLFGPLEANALDEHGRTPLSFSAELADEIFCNYLLSIGAHINSQDREGNTPMHYAFKGGNQIIILNFLSKGGDLNVLNSSSMTPLALGSESLLRVLNLMNLVSSAGYASFDNHLQMNKRYPKDRPQINHLEYYPK